MKLNQDLYDIYSQKIYEAGQELNAPFLRELVEKGAKFRKKLISVCKTPIMKDFESALNDKRYARILASKTAQQKTLKVFRKLRIEEPVALELKNMKRHLPKTYSHVLVMAMLTIKMLKEVKSSRYDPIRVSHLCLTHDIGKTRIPIRVLSKRSFLTREQYRAIRSHPLVGYLLLKYYCGWRGNPYCETAFEHHEKLDGSGYPQGLTRIDPYAQLIAPVDIFDALLSQRPYRKHVYSERLAVDILLEDVKRGKLNRDCVYLIVNCIRSKKARSPSKMLVSQERRENPPGDNLYGKIKKARRLLRRD